MKGYLGGKRGEGRAKNVADTIKSYSFWGMLGRTESS
jgi:hypothetical protein